MRIGIVTNEYPPSFGGVGRSVQRIASGLVKADLNVNVFVLPADSDYTPALRRAQHQHLEDGSIQVHRLQPAVRRPYKYQSGRDVACFEWLCEFIIENQLDLLHCFYISRTGLVTGLAAHECKIPFVASVRGNDLHQDIFSFQGLEQIRWTLQNADLLTFVSRTANERAAIVNQMCGATRVIWNSVDPNDFQTGPVPLEQRADMVGPVIACAGEFRHKKGIERLLEACAMLETPVTLLLIGDFSRSEQEYWFQQVIPVVAPKLHLVITGLVPHSAMLDYFCLADLVAFPSIHDGCPNSFLEAMLAARPIVCARAGAMGDIMEKSQAGIVVEPCSADHLAYQMDGLLKDQALRLKMGELGRAFVLTHLTPEIETAAWLDCYASLQRPR
jgi:L-malate glycosyltransferase